MWKFVKNNIYFWLIYRIVLLVVLYSACRLIFYFYNSVYFDDVTVNHLLNLMVAGLPFDIVAIFAINSVYIFGQVIPFNFRYKNGYQKVMKLLFCITNSVFFFFNCLDFAYFRYTFRRTTLPLLQEFTGNAGNLEQIGQAGNYGWVFFIWVLITLVLIFAYGKRRLILPIIYSAKIYFTKQTIAMLMVMALSYTVLCGGTYNLSFGGGNSAILYIHKPVEKNIVLNTSYTLLKSLY